MIESRFRIIIVGGGIAGLTAAIALRAPGRDILVLERSSMLRELGALISLQPNASKIITSWDLDELLKACEPLGDPSFRIFDVHGNLIQEIHNETEKWGAERKIYHRQDLQKCLIEAATSALRPGDPVSIRTGAQVLSCDPNLGTVSLQSGEVLEADLIIGADGIRSVLRQYVVGKYVESVPTGLSAYRLLIDTAELDELDCSDETFDVRRSSTNLILAHDRRVVFGPGRGNKVLGLVALLPDEKLNEISHSTSWTTPGSLEKLLESYQDFPAWLLQIFKAAPDIALWQLRDLDPLTTWVKDRVILIGDAAHAMLPTQGQGASQSVEDAEALQAFFADISEKPSFEQVRERLTKVFQGRYDRATLVQQFSRQQARPATDAGSSRITLRLDEFAEYNHNYNGVKEWISKEGDRR